MKKEKGITLIALIITIIVMLILVVVIINILTNSELFQKARNASTDTQKELDMETLEEAVFVAMADNNGIFNKNKLTLPEGWSIRDGKYVSPSGNEFTINENGNITYINNN